jgi:hypothetical protein
LIKGVLPKKTPKKYAMMSLMTINEAGNRNLHEFTYLGQCHQYRTVSTETLLVDKLTSIIKNRFLGHKKQILDHF